jgi:Zn-dependent M28 family amino/carboxypeptidase
MHMIDSRRRRARPTVAEVAHILAEVSAERLRESVERISFPRHYVAQRPANRKARNLLLRYLQDFGFAQVALQGEYENIVATTAELGEEPYLLLGAHYDSVPGTPGADDNGSAVAVALECARLLKKHDLGGVMVVFFNREEDGLLGSQEFVQEMQEVGQRRVSEAHIFEMVGYCTKVKGSQRLPAGLPGIASPDVGDFLGLLSNRGSNGIADDLANLAATYTPGFPVLALKIYLGIERYFGHLHRSDHAPFWEAGIPAIMWTDTSEFRNPHYHQATDTPDTLDYDFMSSVTKLALARAITQTR